MQVYAFIFYCLFLSGCTIIHNFDGLMTLNEYSHEQQELHSLVKKTNTRYDRLKKDYQANLVSLGTTTQFIKKKYGDPLLEMPSPDGQTQWLYRAGMWSKGKDKMYLYFDEKNLLVKINLVTLEEYALIKDQE